ESREVFFFVLITYRWAPAGADALEASMKSIDVLRELRNQGGKIRTHGLDEDAQLHALQSGFVNFYPDDAVCPFVPLAARGAWVVTLKGSVLYDCGGYGMLGFGHNPPAVLKALAKPQVMANVMTPSLAQHAFTEALRKEIGHR